MRTLSCLAPALLCALLCAVPVACSKTGGQTGDEDALPPADFYGDLARQQGSGNYRPARDLAELASWSDRIVVGHAVAVRRGRTISSPSRPAEVELRTVVLEIAVERTLKGEAAEALYLEFLVGNAEANLPARLPQDRVIAFAVPVTHDWITDAVVMGSGDGLPEGETLYQLRTPQGYAVETDNGGFVQPFETADGVLGTGTFDGLVERILDAIADDTQPDAAVPSRLCDGSDAIRFAYEVSGGFLSPDDVSLAQQAFSFLYLRGDCHFVVSQGPIGEVRAGDLSTEQAAALAAAVHVDELASLGQTPDMDSCSDTGAVRLLGPEGALSCTCGCPEPRGDTILSAAGEEMSKAWQAGQAIAGPVRAAAYVPPEGIAWWMGSDEPQAWPLDTSLAEITVADAGSVQETSGRVFEGDDAASLRELRRNAQGQGQMLGVQRFPVREGAAGEVHALLVRDELPEDFLLVISRLPAGP